MKTNNLLSTILNSLSSPLFIPSFFIIFFVIISQAKIGLYQFMILMLFIICLTVVFPMFFMFFLKKIGHISSYQMSDKYENRFPLLLGILYLIVCLRVLKIFSAPESLIFSFIAMSFSVFSYYLLLRFYRMSIKIIGISALMAFCLSLCLIYNSNLLVKAAFLLYTFIIYDFLVIFNIEKFKLSYKEITYSTLIGFLPQIINIFINYR